MSKTENQMRYLVRKNSFIVMAGSSQQYIQTGLAYPPAMGDKPDKVKVRYGIKEYQWAWWSLDSVESIPLVEFIQSSKYWWEHYVPGYHEPMLDRPEANREFYIMMNRMSAKWQNVTAKSLITSLSESAIDVPPSEIIGGSEDDLYNMAGEFPWTGEGQSPFHGGDTKYPTSLTVVKRPDYYGGSYAPQRQSVITPINKYNVMDLRLYIGSKNNKKDGTKHKTEST